MGRHSAPDDDLVDTRDGGSPSSGGTAVAVVTAPDRRGRHAHPDADHDAGREADGAHDGAAAAVSAAVTAPLGQAVPWADFPPPVGLVPPATAAPPADTVLPDDGAPAEAAPAAKPSAVPRGSRSDLALLRAHGDVRARVLAGVLAPFAIFTVVMALLGDLGRSYLLWIWIPLVTAGVLGGLFLDLGHRRYRQSGGPSPRG